MHCAGNVIFHDADSASKAILGLGTVAPPEEDPDGFGETVVLQKPCQQVAFLHSLQATTLSTPAYPPGVQSIPVAV